MSTKRKLKKRKKKERPFVLCRAHKVSLQINLTKIDAASLRSPPNDRLQSKAWHREATTTLGSGLLAFLRLSVSLREWLPHPLQNWLIEEIKMIYRVFS